MRTVIIMCINKENSERHYVDLIVKVFYKNPEITWGYKMSIKDVQEWVTLSPKLDACGYCGRYK